MSKLGLIAALLLAAFSVRADQFLPTAEGTSWEYDSMETRTDMAPTRSIITVRASKQLVAGRELVKLETLSNNVISKTELISVDDYGIVCLARSGKDGKLVKLDVEVGDKILFGKYSGTDIKIDGEEVLILREDEVLAVMG